jgi:hypothetical protein
MRSARSEFHVECTFCAGYILNEWCSQGAVTAIAFSAEVSETVLQRERLQMPRQRKPGLKPNAVSHRGGALLRRHHAFFAVGCKYREPSSSSSSSSSSS